MTTRLRLALVALALTGTVHAAPLPELAPGVLLLEGKLEPGRQPDGNSVIFVTPDGLLVVDTGRHAEHTESLLDVAPTMGIDPVAIVNTHWHLDHISGNAPFRKAYPHVKVYGTSAIAEARTGFLADYRDQLSSLIANTDDEAMKRQFEDEIARIDSGSMLVPDVIVNATRNIDIGGTRVELHVTDHAVTAADIWLYEPSSRVLIAGDLVTLPVPFLDTACPQGWRTELNALTKTDFELLVPGHGHPMHRDEVEQYVKALGGLLDCAAGDADADVCITGWLDGVATLIQETDPKFARSLVEYYVSLLRSGRADSHCEGRGTPGDE